MKRLVITEKPSVARDIVAVLGGFKEDDGFWEADDFVVTYAVGHLLELVEPEDLDPKYKRWTLDTLPILPDHFPLKPKEGTRDRLRVIKKLLARDDVNVVVNACDAGREGELIFREVVEYLESDKPIERLWLQSMTKGAIQKGFSALQPGKKYDGLSQAAHCRNYSDWLIGMNATRALTRRLKSKSENQAWSAGRVQTPTLGMTVDREVLILAHVPVPFFRVKGTFSHGEETYAATWFDPNQAPPAEEDEDGGEHREDRVFDEAKAKAMAEKVRGKAGVANETRKPSREAAPPLFDLTSLQREGNRRFGWSARRTLNAAQRCYESHKILTYPRTDARALPNDYKEVVGEVIESLAADSRFTAASKRLKAQGLQNEDKIFDDAKVSDHFAIVPTGVVPPNLQGDDGKLFELVARRFFAAFHPAALWSRVERITVVEGEQFRARSKVLQEPGWREVMGESEGQGGDKLSPLLPGKDEADGVAIQNLSADAEADESKAPARITEARLLSLMENAGKEVEDEAIAEAMKDCGIGTPATRADTIENLISKGYIMRAGRVLRPTVKGIRLIDILRRMHAERLASPALTGELEKHLGNVEKGKMAAKAFMDEIYDYAKEIVELTKTFEFEILFPDTEPLGPCPLCARQVYERSWFYRCKEPEGLAPRVRKKDKAASEAAAALHTGPVVVDCPFRIWKDKSGRYIDRRTVEELLTNKRSRVLDGFLTRQGRSYRGILELAEGEIQLRRVEGGGAADGEDETLGLPEFEVNETPLGSCPHCKEGQVLETRSTYICSQGLGVLRALQRDDSTTFPVKKKEVPEGMSYCPFLIPRSVCKREITREEAIKYVSATRTELLTDFTSKRGRPFSAILYLRETGRHGFDFPPRGKDKEGAGDSTTPAPATAKLAKPPKAAPAKAKKAAVPRARSGDRAKVAHGATVTAKKKKAEDGAPVLAAKTAKAKAPAAKKKKPAPKKAAKGRAKEATAPMAE